MVVFKSFEAVLYSDKVKYKGTFLRPLPLKGVVGVNETSVEENCCFILELY